MHQRTGNDHVVELHGSLWRLRCDTEVKVFDDLEKGKYHTRKCKCGAWLRPDIIWFQDTLNESTVHKATKNNNHHPIYLSVLVLMCWFALQQDIQNSPKTLALIVLKLILKRLNFRHNMINVFDQQ